MLQEHVFMELREDTITELNWVDMEAVQNCPGNPGCFFRFQFLCLCPNPDRGCLSLLFFPAMIAVK